MEGGKKMRSKTGSKLICIFLALFMAVCTISGVQASVDNTDNILTEEDFSSNRLLVNTTKKAIKGETDNIIAQNDNVYLLQYDSPEETMQAYNNLVKKAEFITPDYTFGVSANDSMTDEDTNETYNEDKVYKSVTQDDDRYFCIFHGCKLFVLPYFQAAPEKAGADKRVFCCL